MHDRATAHELLFAFAFNVRGNDSKCVAARALGVEQARPSWSSPFRSASETELSSFFIDLGGAEELPDHRLDLATERARRLSRGACVGARPRQRAPNPYRRSEPRCY